MRAKRLGTATENAEAIRLDTAVGVHRDALDRLSGVQRPAPVINTSIPGYVVTAFVALDKDGDLALRVATHTVEAFVAEAERLTTPPQDQEV